LISSGIFLPSEGSFLMLTVTPSSATTAKPSAARRPGQEGS
jgi:hypothetical protein